MGDLDNTIARIKRNPEYGFNLGDGIRRATLSRIPFYVIYTIGQKEVMVQTIIHQHRDPDEWQKKVPNNLKLNEWNWPELSSGFFY